MQNISATLNTEPFPHIIYHDFYDDDELKLIWEELNFYTKPDKLFDVKDYLGIEGYTKSKAIHLDSVYKGKNRKISNILEVSRKIFNIKILKPFTQIHDCCSLATASNYDITKVRYYHNEDHYKPHLDSYFDFLAFSYFYKEPKKFDGGNLIFPKYNYEYACDNNSVIMMPSWVEHGVSKVSINDSDYYDGYGRYAITHFFGCKELSEGNND